VSVKVFEQHQKKSLRAPTFSFDVESTEQQQQQLGQRVQWTQIELVAPLPLDYYFSQGQHPDSIDHP
jgi:hypothetical protein